MQQTGELFQLSLFKLTQYFKTMEYIILEVKISEDGNTTNTVVEYNIEGNIVIVDIPHFMPKGQNDIDAGINNRLITEMYKLFPERLIQPNFNVNDWLTAYKQ